MDEKTYLYEWEKEDNILLVEKIPIFRVDTKTMNNILFNKFQVSKKILKRIKDKTITETGILQYVCLITDLNLVLALSFTAKGLIKEKSKLLLEEEEYILKKIKDIKKELFPIEIISPIKYDFFLTRKELTIKNILLKEITSLYQKKEYDAINYLYQELFKDKVKVKDQYERLIKRINLNYIEELSKLYEIINICQKEKNL